MRPMIRPPLQIYVSINVYFLYLKVFGILTTMVGINVIFLVHSALLVLGAIFTFIGMY